jgi:hypothetical protein
MKTSLSLGRFFSNKIKIQTLIKYKQQTNKQRKENVRNFSVIFLYGFRIHGCLHWNSKLRSNVGFLIA